MKLGPSCLLFSSESFLSMVPADHGLHHSYQTLSLFLKKANTALCEGWTSPVRIYKWNTNIIVKVKNEDTDTKEFLKSSEGEIGQFIIKINSQCIRPP
mmetsp:Transcript_16708/g.21675  ORF Transcript_16708/g.21675 Transcript_16708/m.21675 type:complete len:98 (+) Transcript_16708:3095-3388(+)